MPEGMLLLTLRIFSSTGGIEKVSRQLGKALYELTNGVRQKQLAVLSMYDEQEDINEKYFPSSIFKGFGKKKLLFTCSAVSKGIHKDTVILSHINLLLPGVLVKLLSPKTKLVLLAHGIEVWELLPAWKKWMLNKCDLVLAVSQFTKNKMMDLHGMAAQKLFVLNNCLDPFLTPPSHNGKDAALLERYQLKQNDIVLMTLTRLSSKERYKGYDRVLYAVQQLKPQYPNLKYLVVGKYDAEEKQWLDGIIAEQELHNNIIFAGFIPDEEIASHFELADLYIMPSRYEGFGIAFIEALYYGKPVIAGNKDGSRDALCNGKFGLLVNPGNQEEITQAIAMVLENKKKYIPNLREVIDKFSFAVYKENLEAVLMKVES